MTLHLRPHLPLNISGKSRLNNKINYLENVIKGRLDNQLEDTVVIFSCSQEQALQSLSAVKNPTLSMGFEVDYEIRFEDKSLKLLGTTPFFGEGSAILGQWDKVPMLPKLPDGFLTFRGYFTLREIFFRDDRQATNPKHLFMLTSSDEGTSSKLELISETALAAWNAKKHETTYAAVNENFNRLLIENVKPNKRPREDTSNDD